MKTFIIGRVPFPYGLASTNRVRCYAEGLNNCNHECEVIVTVATERQDKQVFNTVAIGKYRNVPFRYLSKTTVRATSFLKRRLQDIWSTLKLYKFVLSDVDKCDNLFLYGNHHEFFILVISKIRGIKIYRELCEFPYATGNESFFDKLRSKFNLKFIFPLYTGFVVISEELKKVALKFGSSNSRVIKVPILINIENTDESAYKQDKPYIFHSGTMYEKKDAIVSTFKAFAIASKRLNYSVDFILAGPRSPHQEELERIVKENKLENNVFFLGNLKKDEVERYQNGASLAILNKNDNVQNRCGFSTKLGELLLSGTPVITTTVGEANLWLKNGESAYITEPHNPELIANQIVLAFRDDQKRVKIGLNGKQIAIQNFDCNVQGRRLARFLAGDNTDNLR